MKKIILLLFILSCSRIFLAQDSTVVTFIVSDKVKKTEVNRVAIRINDTVLVHTNNRGEASYSTKLGVELGLKFSHGRYNDKVFSKRISSRSKVDTVFVRVDLSPIRTQVQSEVIVTAPGIPQEVFATDSVSVSDFEIMDGGKILLLTYPKQLKRGNKLILLNGKKVITEFSVKERAEELVHDYRGNPHLICDNSVYGIYIEEDQIGLAPLEKEYFLKYIAPIVDSNKANLYFSNYSEDIPAFDYFQYNQADSNYKKIQSIQDDLMMELYRSEYKYVDVRTKIWAKNKELATGIDAEIWVGANYFTQSIYYKSLYAPMFERNDSLFIFDHYKDLLRIYDGSGDSLTSVSIYHHYDKRETGWKNEIIKDKETGEFYALFERHGYSYLSKINVSTGQLGNQIKLKYKYVENISILSNHAYYIYRPFESAQKKYLYKERLPYKD